MDHVTLHETTSRLSKGLNLAVSYSLNGESSQAHRCIVGDNMLSFLPLFGLF